MTIPEGEAEALAQMKAEVLAEKERMYYHMKEYARMDAAQLKLAGHHSVEAALLYVFKSSQKHIDRIQAAYIQRFPD